MIKLKTNTGKSVEDGIKDILRGAEHNLETKGSREMTRYIVDCIKDHLSQRFPGSRHFDPDKVSGTTTMSGATPHSDIDVDIPGIGRAYHDVVIRPLHSTYLAIPMNRAAYGLSPLDFTDLFGVKGKHALFRKEGSGIVAMFALARQAYQKQDPTMMPSDEELLNSAENAIQSIDL